MRRVYGLLAAGLVLMVAASGCQEPAPGVAAEPSPRVVPRRTGLTPCNPEEVPAALVRDKEGVLLGIPARRQAAGHPAGGWCGETAIQEAMLFCGVFCPQRLINAAGHPRHPDLYANEVPVALKNLGMEIRSWPDGDPRPNLDGFLKWVRGHTDAATPVLCGVKINPTQRPEWSLDHFVLAVGHTDESLVFNTTWGTRVARTEKQLRSTTEKGFALANRYRSYYGIAVVGPADRTEDDVPVRLFVGQENREWMTLVLRCDGLQPGARYAIYRLAPREDKTPSPIHQFVARSKVAGFRDLISKDRPAIYRCRKVSGGG